MIYQAIPIPSTWCTKNDTVYLLDIETTGLCKEKDHIIMIGLLENVEGKFFYHSWLLEQLEEENIIIQGFLTHLLPDAKLYTYSGNTFDISFILERANQYGLDVTGLTTLPKIDFKRLSLFKKFFSNKKVSRSSLEEMLHYKRELTTGGRELVKICKLYLTTHNIIYKDLIKAHNKEDLLSLLTFWRFYQLTLSIHSRQLQSFSYEDHKIMITFVPLLSFTDALSLTLGDYRFNYDSAKNILCLCLEAKKMILKQYLPYKDYYLINGQLTHRSIAQFMPSNLKQKATKETAFLEKEAYFIPTLKKEARWVDDSKKGYLLFEEAVDDQSIILKDLYKTITRGLIN